MKVQATTEIRASPELVFAFIAVPENGPRWQEGAVWTRVTTPGPIGIGSHMEHLGRWLWMRIPTTAVVTVFEPPHRYGYDIATSMFPEPAPVRYTLEPTSEGTRLTLSNTARMPRWLRPLEPLFRRNAQGMFERDVARLKTVIEADPTRS